MITLQPQRRHGLINRETDKSNKPLYQQRCSEKGLWRPFLFNRTDGKTNSQCEWLNPGVYLRVISCMKTNMSTSVFVFMYGDWEIYPTCPYCQRFPLSVIISTLPDVSSSAPSPARIRSSITALRRYQSIRHRLKHVSRPRSGSSTTDVCIAQSSVALCDTLTVPLKLTRKWTEFDSRFQKMFGVWRSRALLQPELTLIC